jgi:hypothetical protein
MEFIETSIFTKLIYTYLTDDEYVGLQGFMLKHPKAGKIVPVPAGSENYDGPVQAGVSAAAYGSFTTSRNRTTKSGC